MTSGSLPPALGTDVAPRPRPRPGPGLVPGDRPGSGPGPATTKPPVEKTDELPPAFRGAAASRSVRWSGVAIIGKQVFQLGCAVALARILGPSTYGVISEAAIYVTLTTMMLDQGLSSALIQRPKLSPKAPGAAQSMNIAMALLLGALTWLFAGAIADFLNNSLLIPVLHVLGAGIVLKAVAIAPRAMLSRRIDFKSIARSDILGSALGAAAGITAAVLGAGYYSLLWQVLITDFVIASSLLRFCRGPVPNLHLGELRDMLPFGARIFATNSIAYLSRNVDNILVAKFLGRVALANYGMAYRALAIPVQLLGQTVNRVLFPAFSRLAGQREEIGRTLLISTQLLSVVALPLMSLVASASHEEVMVVLGPRWLPTVPLLATLALAGARETIFYVTPSLMMASDRSDLNLRFQIFSTAVQVAGMVIGLQFGVVGVALGYAIAGCFLSPVLLLIQRRLTGVTLGRQLGALLPPAHACIWAALAYFGVRMAGLPDLVTLLLGALAFVLVYAGVLRVVHPAYAESAFTRLRKLRPRSKASSHDKPKSYPGGRHLRRA